MGVVPGHVNVPPRNCVRQLVVTKGDVVLVDVAVQVERSTAASARIDTVVQVERANGYVVPRLLGHVPARGSQGTAVWLVAPTGLLQVLSTKGPVVAWTTDVVPLHVAASTNLVSLLTPGGRSHAVS